MGTCAAPSWRLPSPLALTLGVTSCQSGGGHSNSPTHLAAPASSGPASTGPAAGTPSASAVASGGDGSASTITDDQLVTLFAGAGIATYADATDEQPEQAVSDKGLMKLTGWQLQNMRRQLNSGRGYLASDLDALTADTGAGKQPVPLSIVLAGWISAAQTPAADAARQLVGASTAAAAAQAPFSAIYPDAVLDLFVSDVAGPAVGSGKASPAAFLRAAPPGGVCSDVQNFVDNAFASIVQALTVEAGEGATGVLGTIWNVIVTIAAKAAQLALGALTTTLLAPIRKVLSIVAILSTASSTLTPWQVTTTLSPGSPIQPNTAGKVTATIDPGPDPWPADIEDCASFLLGQPIPPPNDTKGSTATWQVDDPDQTITLGLTTTPVDPDNQSVLDFTTTPEDPSYATGQEHDHDVAIHVKVDRAQVDQLQDLINGIILGALPGPISSLLSGIIGEAESPARAALAELASEAGPVTAFQTITHDPPEPTPGATPTDCAVADPTTIPDGKWSGKMEMTDLVGKGQGSADVTTVSHSHHGNLTLVVKDGKVVSGGWGMNWESVGHADEPGVEVNLDVTGWITKGTVSGPASKPELSGGWTIQGLVKTSYGDTPFPQMSGDVHETMQIETDTCDDVVGDLLLSFNSHGTASFTGDAEWTGKRVG